MRFLRASSEAEMVAEFLRQEYASAERYRARIQECLKEEDTDPSLIIDADLTNDAENAMRRCVLGLYRGYDIDKPSFFTDFPSSGVDWQWVALTPDELLDSKYIRYDFWSQLSGGTRSPRDAAIRLQEGWIPTEEGVNGSRERFLTLTHALRNGLPMPPLILVSADAGKTRVVLEGHTRLTAYALAPDTLSDEIEVLLGMSPEIARWDEY